EENARLITKIIRQASLFEKAELEARNAKLIERIAKLKDKQLENIIIKNSCVSASGQVS
ncbi:2176_t:CDS:1, partial [Funneliformis caledonium]